MTERPAIIMPAVPFASQADRTCALSVMRPIMTDRVEARQITLIAAEKADISGAICSVGWADDGHFACRPALDHNRVTVCCR